MSRLSKLIAELCPGGVEYKALGDCCRYQNKVTVRKKELLLQGLYPVMNSSRKPIGYSDVANNDGNAFVIVSHGVYAGYCSYMSGNYLAGSLCHPYKSFDESVLLSKFAFYFVRNSELDIRKRFVSSSGVPYINRKALEHGLRIPVPPIEVQREIVRLLDEYTAVHDELVKQLLNEIELRKQQRLNAKQAVFDNCSGVYVRIGELFPFIRNGFVGTVTNHFTDAEHGVRYLEGMNIHGGRIDDDECIYVTKEFHQAHLRSELRADDVLVVQSGHVGECAVVGKEYVGANCHALIVMSNGGGCDSRFIVHYLYSTEGKKQLAKMTTGGTVKHILASKIGRIVVPLPTVEQQKKFVMLFDEMDEGFNVLINKCVSEIGLLEQQLVLVRNYLLSIPEKVN